MTSATWLYPIMLSPTLSKSPKASLKSGGRREEQKSYDELDEDKRKVHKHTVSNLTTLHTQNVSINQSCNILVIERDEKELCRY